MQPSSPLDHVIAADLALTASGRRAIRFIGDLHLALSPNRQSKHLAFVVDTTAKVTLVPIHLIHKLELIQVYRGHPMPLRPPADSDGIILYRFALGRGEPLYDRWFECECRFTLQKLPTIRLAFGNLFEYFHPSVIPCRVLGCNFALTLPTLSATRWTSGDPEAASPRDFQRGGHDSRHPRCRSGPDRLYPAPLRS